MNENRFIEKFQKKTDSELKFILENRKKYNEKALAAAIYILNDRNGKSPEIETIENIIKIEKSKLKKVFVLLLDDKKYVISESKEIKSKK